MPSSTWSSPASTRPARPRCSSRCPSTRRSRPPRSRRRGSSLPARYGQPVEPPAVYDGYFDRQPTDAGPGSRRRRPTSTAARRSPGAIDETLPDAARHRGPAGAGRAARSRSSSTRRRACGSRPICRSRTTSRTPTRSRPADFLDPGERAVLRGRRRAATRTSSPAWLEQFGPDRLLRALLRGAHRATRRSVLRGRRDVARARPDAAPGRRARRRRTGRWRSRAGGSSASRSA